MKRIAARVEGPWPSLPSAVLLKYDSVVPVVGLPLFQNVSEPFIIGFAPNELVRLVRRMAEELLLQTYPSDEEDDDYNPGENGDSEEDDYATPCA